MIDIKTTRKPRKLFTFLLITQKKKKNQAFSGMVVQAYNPSTWAGRS
jgi:hypothetical protein